VVGRQPYAPAAFTPGEIPGTHFQRLSRPQGTWFCGGYHGKKSPLTPPGIDTGTVRLVAQCLNHYATPGPYKTNNIWYLKGKNWSICTFLYRVHAISLRAGQNTSKSRSIFHNHVRRHQTKYVNPVNLKPLNIIKFFVFCLPTRPI